MRFKLIIISYVFLVMTASQALADEKHLEKPMDQQAMMEMWMKLAQPGEPHKLFASLAGNWTTKSKEWMEPGKPPTESTGSAEMKMLLDGRFLYQEYTGQMMGQPFSGIGIDAYDNVQEKYVTAWMDTMGTGIFKMEGTASDGGKTITLKGNHSEPGGGQMTHRAVWKLIDNNTQTFEMWGTHHGGKEMKMFEITYTRK
jgi:hypothetical protein